MTTPPTPSGWYPDPDGSGGQRFWDGSAWTEHRSPGTPPAAEPPAAPEPPASEQPTAIVSIPPTPTEERGGAHRAPEPEAEGPTRETQPVPLGFTPDVRPTPPPPELFGPPPPSAPAFETPPPPPPPPSAPAFETPPPAAAPSAPDGRGKLLTWYLAACTGLLALLVLAVIYGLFINDTDTVAIESGDDATTTTETSASATTTDESTSAEPTESATDSPTTVAGGGEATDGPIAFTVHGVEIGSTVVSSNAPVEKDAQGQYVVVHMTVTNVSDQPTTFIGTLQKLKAGGTTYNIDDEATFYLDSGLAELPPGGQADVSVAFDVPPGTVPEAIELHTDPMSPGVEVPLP